jgi:hypothetical protein
MAKKTATEKKVSSAFHEVYEKVPKTVKATGKTGEAKRKMMVAVALSKARAAGAKIPKGGNTTLDRGDMKASMCADREDNLTSKEKFVSGSHAKS